MNIVHFDTMSETPVITDVSTALNPQRCHANPISPAVGRIPHLISKLRHGAASHTVLCAKQLRKGVCLLILLRGRLSAPHDPRLQQMDRPGPTTGPLRCGSPFQQAADQSRALRLRLVTSQARLVVLPIPGTGNPPLRLNKASLTLAAAAGIAESGSCFSFPERHGNPSRELPAAHCISARSAAKASPAADTASRPGQAGRLPPGALAHPFTFPPQAIGPRRRS